MFLLDLRLAGRGQLQKDIARTQDLLGQAFTRGLKVTMRDLQLRLRAASQTAGLGRLSRAWTFEVYPQVGGSLSAAARVRGKGGSRTQGALEAHASGGTIKAKSKRFLAIPTAAAPKRGEGNKPLSPTTFPVARFGPLRFVALKGGRALLVVDGVRVSAAGRVTRIRPGRKSGVASLRARATVPMFVLVPAVRLRRRVDVLRLARQATERIPINFAIEAGRIFGD